MWRGCCCVIWHHYFSLILCCSRYYCLQSGTHTTLSNLNMILFEICDLDLLHLLSCLLSKWLWWFILLHPFVRQVGSYFCFLCYFCLHCQFLPFSQSWLRMLNYCGQFFLGRDLMFNSDNIRFCFLLFLQLSQVQVLFLLVDLNKIHPKKSYMSSLVSFKISTLWKSLMALWALVRSFTCMSSDMDL